MATQIFPTSLPAPLISGYGYKDDDGNISRTPKTFGYQTQKQIGNTPYTNFPINLILTQTQMAIFEDFYKDDLINGHKWFIMKISVGSGYAYHYCRMITKYKASLLSNAVWGVGFEIETNIKILITESEYNALIV